MGLQQNLITMLAPAGGVAPAATAVVIAANAARAYLIIWNISDELVALGFDGEDAVVDKGVSIPAGGFYELRNGVNLVQGAIEMLSASGGKKVTWQEGNFRAS